ncbi:MAG TPA: CoA transferase [Polyangiaceae bacterium]|jgi:crotonobetainyl-CoA:carnitine CoA-transferase CaiB-like acyl-CoA transferase|nr:CoA transferase [Polyangiaceae bacterium]
MATNSLFSGLKVVDLASFIAGPSATTVLSDFGADVIKVEPPGIGDPYRYLYRLPPNPPLKENYTWQLTNRNKRGLAIDLKHPSSRPVLERLVKWADVLVTNFPPRVRQGLKVTYEELAPLNPRLVYADITGYGENGPEADKPGFDVTAFWARSGLMQFTRDASAPPAIPVPGIGDHATAISLYSAIVTGLYQRERTGKGSKVSTSLIAAGAWATAAWLQAALFGAKFSGEIDRKHPANALGGTYQTADRRWIVLTFIEEDKNWSAFCKTLGQDALLQDPRFADATKRHANASALVEELDELFAGKSLADWKPLLDAAHVPYGVTQIPEEIVADPQLWANDIIVPIDDGSPTTRYTVDSPFTVAGAPKVPPRLAPDLGQHSEEVLAELGYDIAQINALRAAGVVPQQAQPAKSPTSATSATSARGVR